MAMPSGALRRCCLRVVAVLLVLSQTALPQQLRHGCKLIVQSPTSHMEYREGEPVDVRLSIEVLPFKETSEANWRMKAGRRVMESLFNASATIRMTLDHGITSSLPLSDVWTGATPVTLTNLERGTHHLEINLEHRGDFRFCDGARDVSVTFEISRTLSPSALYCMQTQEEHVHYLGQECAHRGSRTAMNYADDNYVIENPKGIQKSSGEWECDSVYESVEACRKACEAVPECFYFTLQPVRFLDQRIFPNIQHDTPCAQLCTVRHSNFVECRNATGGSMAISGGKFCPTSFPGVVLPQAHCLHAGYHEHRRAILLNDEPEEKQACDSTSPITREDINQMTTEQKKHWFLRSYPHLVDSFTNKTQPPPKLVVFYANCQSKTLHFFLTKSPVFRQKYGLRAVHVKNWFMLELGSNTKLDAGMIKLLQMADLFVYQPISLKHGVFTTEIDPATGEYVPESVLTYLRPTCVRISFPYMYNNAFWPLVNRPYKTAINTESITRLLAPIMETAASTVASCPSCGANVNVTLQQVKEEEAIIGKFMRGEIDFNFAERWEKTLKLLEKKEEGLDVQIATYVRQHAPRTRLFFDDAHPTSELYVHCVRQMLEVLGIPPDDFGVSLPLPIQQLPPYLVTNRGMLFGKEHWYQPLSEWDTVIPGRVTGEIRQGSYIPMSRAAAAHFDFKYTHHLTGEPESNSTAYYTELIRQIIRKHRRDRAEELRAAAAGAQQRRKEVDSLDYF